MPGRLATFTLHSRAIFFKMKFTCKSLLVVVLLFAAESVTAQRWLGLRSEADTLEADKSGLVLLPLLYYTPDTRFAYGAAGVYYFRLKDRQEREARLSYAQLLVDYTQNKQLDVWGQWNILTGGERFLLKGELRFRNFPDRFYGIGNNTPQSAEERYSYDLLSFKFLMLRNLGRKWFAGFDVHAENEYNFSRQAGGLLDGGNINGFDGGVSVGFGGVAVHDSRDNVVNAHKGHFFEVAAYFYQSAFGSDFTYKSINAAYHTYKKVGTNQVLAWQVVGRLNSGEVPFLNMATAGGISILRGYASNRYRDHNMMAGQMEYRFGIWKRFGGVAFAGVGDVFKQPSEIRLDLLKYSVGGGIRFAMNPAERLNIRLDYGIGRGEQAFYLIITEAF
jgi:hypothetical protein